MTRPLRIEPCAKRIRVVLAGEVVVDTTRAQLVWVDRPYPVYYLPETDVRTDLLEADAPGAVHRHAAVPDHVSLTWSAMDHWFEEDEEVYVHARSPYTRVDVLPSSRSVRVDVDGVTVADSHHPTLLFETGLPTRYYFPKTDVRLDLLVATDKATACPYKGRARYWSVRAGDTLHPDLAWAYDFPLPESLRIAGLISFYNERVDLTVDGTRQERPQTPFS